MSLTSGVLGAGPDLRAVGVQMVTQSPETGLGPEGVMTGKKSRGPGDVGRQGDKETEERGCRETRGV